jgi:hypothetical protein
MIGFESGAAHIARAGGLGWLVRASVHTGPMSLTIFTALWICNWGHLMALSFVLDGPDEDSRVVLYDSSASDDPAGAADQVPGGGAGVRGSAHPLPGKAHGLHADTSGRRSPLEAEAVNSGRHTTFDRLSAADRFADDRGLRCWRAKASRGPGRDRTRAK